MGRWTVDLQIRTTEAAATGHHRWRDSDNKHPFLRALRWEFRDPGARSGAWFRYACPCSALTWPFLGTRSLFIRVLIIKSSPPNLVHTQLPCKCPASKSLPSGPPSISGWVWGGGREQALRPQQQAGDTCWRTLMATQPESARWHWEQKTKTFSNKAKPAFLKKFIYLAAWGLSYGMWGLQLQQVNSQLWHMGSSSLKPGPPALGAWSLGHRTPGKSRGKTRFLPWYQLQRASLVAQW